MTDKKLMKVLECCANDDCGNCPTQVKRCRQHAMLNALDLIKRRDEEIEEQDQAIINALHHMRVVRVEAIKEFAERLKERKYQSTEWSHGGHPFVVEEDDIDDVLEEMTEGN